MNDRELLELAAQAAGILLVWDGDSPKEVTEHWSCDPTEPPHEREWDWNPVSDDGDALRLAVRLGMKLSTNLHHRFVTVNDEQEFYDEAKFGGVCDPDGVMRRTIVCVAAEIGKGIQLQTAEGVLEDNYYKSQAEAEELGRQMQEGGAA